MLAGLHQPADAVWGTGLLLFACVPLVRLRLGRSRVRAARALARQAARRTGDGTAGCGAQSYVARLSGIRWRCRGSPCGTLRDSQAFADGDGDRAGCTTCGDDIAGIAQCCSGPPSATGAPPRHAAAGGCRCCRPVATGRTCTHVLARRRRRSRRPPWRDAIRQSRRSCAAAATSATRAACCRHRRR